MPKRRACRWLVPASLYSATFSSRSFASSPSSSFSTSLSLTVFDGFKFNNETHLIPILATTLKPNVVEPQPSNGTVQLLGTSHSQHDTHLPGLSLQKQSKILVDGVKRLHERSLAGEQENKDRGLQKKFTKKKSKFCGAYMRQSECIKKAIVCSPKANFDIEVNENIIVSDSEKDEVDAQMEQVLGELELVLDLLQDLLQEHESKSEQEESLSEKSLDEKIDSALHRIDYLDKTFEWLKSKVEETGCFCETPSVAPIGYKSMYFDS